MSNRIVIDENFDIDYDGMRCYALIQKKMITGEGRGSHLTKKDSIGKIREIEMGYYKDFKSALEAYVDKSVGMTAVDISSAIQAIEKCVEVIKGVAELPKNMAAASRDA